MRRITTAILACLLLPVTSVASRGDTLRVPEDYPTIQDAADASSIGDVIELGPGTWHQRVWGLSGVTLRGREGAAATIIDGSNDNWSPVVCYGYPVTIEGITFRNGPGSNIYGIVRGGAIYVEFTPYTIIQNCRFENNSVSIGNYSDAIGGAVCGYFAEMRLSNCLFQNNSANKGGAVYSTFASSLEVDNCFFFDNMASEGGGIMIHETPFTIEDCIFNGNLADWQGGGILVDATEEDTPPLQGSILDSDFTRNAASDYGFGRGGGLAIIGNHAAEAIGCSFQDNYAYTGGGILSGELADEAPPLPVSSSLFCGNFFDDYSYQGITDDGTNNFNQTCWCSTDIDNDGIVGVDDLLELLGAWGQFYHPDFDANNDQVIDVNDLLAVVDAWGRDCSNNSW